MLKCRIRWIDAKGEPTPDDNPAIGHAYIIAHVEPYVYGGVAEYPVPESEHFPICAEHEMRMRRERLQWWRFEPLKEGE